MKGSSLLLKFRLSQTKFGEFGSSNFSMEPFMIITDSYTSKSWRFYWESSLLYELIVQASSRVCIRAVFSDYGQNTFCFTIKVFSFFSFMMSSLNFLTLWKFYFSFWWIEDWIVLELFIITSLENFGVDKQLLIYFSPPIYPRVTVNF